MPKALINKDIAQAFYGVTRENLQAKLKDEKQVKTISAEIALAAEDIIKSLIRVDWYSPNNLDLQKKMVHQIGDYIIDEIRDKYDLTINFQEIDTIAERIVEIAKIRHLK